MTRPDEFICTVDGCGRVFNRAGKLADHFNAHKGRRPYTCTICEKTFTRADHLKRHLLVHDEPSVAEKFKCDICQKGFKIKHQLKRHLKTHKTDDQATQDSTWTCNVCIKNFKSKRQLNKHQKRHEKVYSCSFCHQIFPNRQLLVCHQRIQHLSQSDTEQALRKLWRCDDCGKVVSSRYSLNVHKKNVHLKEKSFVCTICSCAFGYKKSLTKHQEKCKMNDNSNI